MGLLKILRRWLLESPGGKTIFSAVIPILVGVFSATFIVEIMVGSQLDWGRFYRAKSFYVLLVLAGAIYWYNRASFSSERELDRFREDAYCKAYMMSQCLPEVAEQYRDRIRNGDTAAFAEAMKEVQKVVEK